MRQRAVNEKAVEKIISFLNDFNNSMYFGSKFNPSESAKAHSISNGTFSALKKLGYVYTNPQGWFLPVNIEDNRDVAIKVLEFLRQRNQKEPDNPIEPSWVPEILSIKQLLVEIRDNIAKTESASKGLKSASNRRADLVYLAGCVAGANIKTYITGYRQVNKGILDIAEDLLNQIEERSKAN